MTPLTESAEYREAVALMLDAGLRCGDHLGFADAIDVGDCPDCRGVTRKHLRAALPALSRWFVRRNSEALRAEATRSSEARNFAQFTAMRNAAEYLDTLKEEG